MIETDDRWNVRAWEPDTTWPPEPWAGFDGLTDATLLGDPEAESARATTRAAGQAGATVPHSDH